MSGLLEVDCSGCGRRHVTNAEQARKERVLRCECGQFLRLDRALAERRSEPAAPSAVERSRRDAQEEDEETHMLDSLAAVAAMSGRSRPRSPQPSVADRERNSRPAPGGATLRSLPPAPARQPSIAPSDKPLWYVDLGGTELVEMTIEQLILARRSGKLGEGALVWREGMPSWRPVGTLIPAGSASSHPSPLPTTSSTPMPSSPPAAIRTPLPAATRTPLPAAPHLSIPGAPRLPTPGQPPPPKRAPVPNAPSAAGEEPTPQSLASYERPLATLEFALENAERGALRSPTRSPFPSVDTSAVQASRLRTPFPRVSLSAPLAAPLPRPARLPPLGSFAASAPSERPSPLPPPPPPPPSIHAYPSPVGSDPMPATRNGDRSTQLALVAANAAGALSERPRWVSVCIALTVCVSASAAGALLVRSLRQQRLAPASAAVAAPAIGTLAHSEPSSTPVSAPSSAPLVVDLESLSVEHKRSAPRAPAVVVKPAAPRTRVIHEVAPAATEATEATEAPEAPEATSPEPRKSTDATATARQSPYGSGSLIDQIKKATADDEAEQ